MLRYAPMFGFIDDQGGSNTAASPWITNVPTELTICWGGGNTWTFDGSVEVSLDPNGKILVRSMPNGTFICISADAPPPGANIVLVQRKSADGNLEISLYFDGYLDSTTSSTSLPIQPGGTITLTGTTDLLRLFNQAMDPTKDDMFVIDDPVAPFPKTLAAAYNWFTSPPMELVSNATLTPQHPMMITAGGGTWPTTQPDEMPSAFDPSANMIDGISVQAWVYLMTGVLGNVATINGSAHTVSIAASMKAITVTVDGTTGSVNMPAGSVEGWFNLTVTVSKWMSAVTVWINDVSIGSFPCPIIGNFGTQTTLIGGAPVGIGGWFKIQSIFFFDSVAHIQTIPPFMYDQPTVQDGCTGGVMYFDNADPIDFISGAPLQVASQYVYSVPEAASGYVYPAPGFGRPGAAAAALSPWHSRLRLANGSVPSRAVMPSTRHAHADILWNGTEQQPWPIQAAVVGDACRFYILTTDGPLEIHGLTCDPNDGCKVWMFQFIGTALIGLLSAITMVPGNATRIRDYVEACLADNARVQAIRTWLGSQGGGGVDYAAYFTLMKGLWGTGKIGWALWEYYADLNWWDRWRAVLSITLTVTSFLSPPNPGTAAWITLLAAQLLSTFTSLGALLKNRPAGCPAGDLCQRGAGADAATAELKELKGTEAVNFG